MNFEFGGPGLRIVGLDIETERKGSDWGDWGFKNFFCGDIREDGRKGHAFSGFRPDDSKFGDWADELRRPNTLVVAHNAAFDLDGVNGELTRRGLEPLPPLLVSDTLKHGTKAGKMHYRTLASLCDQYGVEAKGSISSADWDKAYAHDYDALSLVKEYNVLDVVCVLALRRAMIDRGHLKAPKMWRP